MEERLNILEEQMKKAKYYIFDIDGTMVDLEELNYRSFLETYKQIYNVEPTRQDYKVYLAGTKAKDAFIRYCRDKQLDCPDPMVLLEKFWAVKEKELMEDFDRVVNVKEGVVEFVKLLEEKGFDTCVATSSIKKFAEHIIGNLGVRELFEVFITADDVTKGKPFPEIYDMAEQRLGAAEEDCIVFEDSRNGIRSATTAGLFCVGIYNKGLNDKFIGIADCVVEDFRPCIQILESL